MKIIIFMFLVFIEVSLGQSTCVQQCQNNLSPNFNIDSCISLCAEEGVSNSSASESITETPTTGQKTKEGITGYFNPKANAGVVKNVYKGIDCYDFYLSPANINVYAKDFNSCTRLGTQVKVFEDTMNIEKIRKEFELSQKLKRSQTAMNQVRSSGGDINEFAFNQSIQNLQSKENYAKFLLGSYSLAFANLGGQRLLAGFESDDSALGWNSGASEASQSCLTPTDGTPECIIESNVNKEMKTVIGAKLIEYSQKIYTARTQIQEYQTERQQLLSNRSEIASNDDATSAQAFNEFCAQNPHLESCQSGQNTFQPTFTQNVGSGQLNHAGGSINVRENTTGEETSSGSTFASYDIPQEAEANPLDPNTGKANYASASGGAGGSAPGSAPGAGSGGGSGLGGSPEAQEDDAAKGGAKVVRSSDKLSIYKKGRKKRRAIASRKVKKNKNFLAKYLKNKNENNKKGGVTFDNRKELNRALARQGVRKSRSLSIFSRISRAHKLVLKPGRKELLVYN